MGKREQKAAKNDPEYIQMMEEALSLFQQKEYEKAIAKYEEAHNRRPKNVYPLVMIEDVETAKELITAQTKPENVAILENNIPNAKPPEYKETEIRPKETLKKEVPEVKQETPVKPPEPIVINTPEKVEKDLTAKPKAVIAEKEKEKVYEHDGVFRETLKEGSATVYQITIVKKGNATVLRHVVHSWGGVFYFKDKDAISKQEYEKLVAELAGE